MFTTVLIANRGEIAVRVIRTCREMGLRTVAAYSSADRDSSAVHLADAAVHIGPAPARSSYLNVPAIIETARQAGADAVHPGYGFLSEDPDFVEICEANGIVFIGPPASLMAQVADKARARTLMAEAGLPVLPGSKEAFDSAALAKETADVIGYPLIMKAAAGGGGRGMAVVHHPRDLLRTWRETRDSARDLFGDPRLYLERFLKEARHVEVQVLGDRYGNLVHLGERDCSVQRRKQKLLEETPAPGLPPGLAARIRDAAVRGAGAIGYVGAGTLEFLVHDGGFSFMEINCRLQVEHPVSEMVTGIDLVREQIRVAQGERLGLRQADVQPRGVAIEARINAEDPDRFFLPTPGVIEECQLPAGPFTRVDSHVFPGARITADYDSLLAKTTVWAPDRDQAIARMRRALAEVRVTGGRIRTTADFLREVLADPQFRSAAHTTALVDRFVHARQLGVVTR